jgi:hypothetical protein
MSIPRCLIIIGYRIILPITTMAAAMKVLKHFTANGKARSRRSLFGLIRQNIRCMFVFVFSKKEKESK